MNREKLLRFAGIFRGRFKEAEISSSSVMIAYYLLLALFPLLILVGNILSLFHVEVARVMEYIHVLVPPDVQPLLDSLAKGLLGGAGGGLLSLSVIGLVWSASKGINYLQRGMNKAYGVQAEGNFVARRLLSLLSLLLLVGVLVVFLVVYTLGGVLLEAVAPVLPWAAELDSILSEVKWPTTFVFLFLILLAAYYITPDVRIRLREAAPGALLAMLGLAGLVQAFSLYLQFVTRSLSSYGALGAFFLLMFWLNFSAMIVMLGCVLNAAVSEYLHGEAEARTERVDTFFKTRIELPLRRRFGKKERPGDRWQAGEGEKAKEAPKERDTENADVPGRGEE